MGSHAALPDGYEDDKQNEETRPRLGELLSGRLSNVEIDSVKAVRDHRERR
jgi:hypothetical protein